MQFILIVSLLVLAPAGQNAPPSASDGGAAYYFLLGRHYESEGRIDEAIAAHKRASALDPASAELVAELAGLYARQNRALDAVETAERALKLDPEQAEANRILGTIYAALGDQRMALRSGDDPAQYAARAIDALEKGRRDGDFDVGLEATLGRLYVQTGAFEKAVPLLQRVVADQPAYLEGALLLAAAQEGAGRLDDAIGTLRNLL
ncbi:MAG TPA: tetratricopeptide repeat protein, partial [Vicinamibacterales bacterium]|nr:tetratricopeptide repeat protein [Vicinamibacterales bacterium]